MSTKLGHFIEVLTKTLKQWSPLSLPLSNGLHSKVTTARMENWTQRVRLAVAYRALDAYGLNEGICNHLTTIAPSRSGDGGKVMLVIPYGLLWSEVTPSNLVGLNDLNEIVEGVGEVEITAVCIHRGVYKARPEIQAVMHTHMPYATALACLKDKTLRMVHQNSTRFLNRMAYDQQYGGIAHAEDEGCRISKALGSMDAMLMGNHGALTVGQTVAVAFDHMYYLERAAHIQVLAMSTSKELEELTPEVSQMTSATFWQDMNKYANLHLEAQQKKLAKSHPEFKEY